MLEWERFCGGMRSGQHALHQTEGMWWCSVSGHWQDVGNWFGCEQSFSPDILMESIFDVSRSRNADRLSRYMVTIRQQWISAVEGRKGSGGRDFACYISYHRESFVNSLGVDLNHLFFRLEQSDDVEWESYIAWGFLWYIATGTMYAASREGLVFLRLSSTLSVCWCLDVAPLSKPRFRQEYCCYCLVLSKPSSLTHVWVMSYIMIGWWFPIIDYRTQDEKGWVPIYIIVFVVLMGGLINSASVDINDRKGYYKCLCNSCITIHDCCASMTLDVDWFW